MDPESDLSQNEAKLAARQDQLERQIAELSRKLTALEQQLPFAQTPFPAVTAPARPLPPPRPHSAPADLSAALTTRAGTSPGTASPLKPARASLETRLGSQVFNRVGIVALLIGATWFLKLAVDNQWIGATGRVLIGLLAGAGLVLWSERFRRKGFPAFSYSLKAIGSGVLYLTLWASFQLFHLLPAAPALIAMLLVTAWNAYMAWSQNAELLAAYALAGGLATPLLLSTGGNHETFLFTYLLAIDLASVALSRLRSWPRLLAAALPATAAYFIGWYTSFFAPAELGLTILFVLLFFATFNAAVFDGRRDALVAPFKSPLTDTIITRVALPFANALFVSLALYSILQDSGYHDLLPWLMVALSATYLALMRLPQRRITSSVHLSLAVVFLTIAIPLKLSGPSITLGWLVEGVALLWVSTRTTTESATEPGVVLRILASASLLLGFGGILTELFFAGMFTRPHFFNRGFGTALAGLVCFALAIAIAYRAPRSTFHARPTYPFLAASLLILFNLTAIFAGVVQINLLGGYSSPGNEAALQRGLAVSAFLMLYGALLLAAGFWKRSAFVRWQALLLLVFTIAKTFLYDMRNLSQGYRVLSFFGLGALLMAVSFAYQKDWLNLREPSTAQPRQEPSE